MGGMPCPRCEGPRLELRLAGNTASVCERCGHVGISADLQTMAEPEESWEASLNRYRKLRDG